MAREDDFATLMAADATLVAILTGGIYKSGTVGNEGITRETAPTTFDANGYLKPCALVAQRAAVPDNQVRDGMAQHTSTVQVVEIWLYQDGGGYTSIDAAKARLYVLFEGYPFADSLPVESVNEVSRERDEGALKGASLERVDFAVYSVRGV